MGVTKILAETKRKKAILLGFVLAAGVVAVGVVNRRPFEANWGRFPKSYALTMTYLGRTNNNNIVLELRNCSAQRLYLVTDVEFYYRDRQGFERPGGRHFFDAGKPQLAPGGSLQIKCAAPKGHFPWKAEVYIVGQRQISFANSYNSLVSKINSKLPFAFHERIVRPSYVETDWDIR